MGRGRQPSCWTWMGPILHFSSLKSGPRLGGGATVSFQLPRSRGIADGGLKTSPFPSPHTLLLQRSTSGKLVALTVPDHPAGISVPRAQSWHWELGAWDWAACLINIMLHYPFPNKKLTFFQHLILIIWPFGKQSILLGISAITCIPLLKKIDLFALNQNQWWKICYELDG